MNTLTNRTVLTLLASLTFVALTALPAAAQPRLMLVAPEPDPALVPDYDLPRFGFSSFNIGGVGERVTNVRRGGLASRLGLEPGDILLSMNGYRLNYHGAWNDALYRAMADGGWVQLRIRDVRTGYVAMRQTFVGGDVGPVTHNYYAGGGVAPRHSHVHRNHVGRPIGPVTAKSTITGSPR